MQPAIATDPEVSFQIDALSAWIEAQRANQEWPGLSIALVHDQTVIWSQGFGWRNLDKQEPATAATIYRVASITKLFTATAILQLRDAGALRLDDPIQEHLPWFSIRSRFDHSLPVTVRHLLTHTAGLPREAAFAYWNEGNFPTLQQIQTTLPDQEAALATETVWKYSNLALSLAGEIVAACTGAPYSDYVEEHILQPLGMEKSYIRTIDPDHPTLATGYNRRLPGTIERAVSPFTDCRAIAPAANLATTVEDLARFCMLQFRTESTPGESAVLRGSTLLEMQRMQWLDPDWTAGWGLGFRILRRKDKTYVGHAGSLRGYRSQLLCCPADKLAVIVLINATDADPLTVVDKAFDWVGPAIVTATADATKAEKEKSTWDPAWTRYLGKYRSPWGDSQVMAHDGELVVIAPAMPDPMPDRMRLVPVAEHTFRIESKQGYGAHGELLVFDIDDEGAATRIHMGLTYADRIEQW